MKTALISLLLLVPGVSRATVQQRDKVRIGSEVGWLAEMPLRQRIDDRKLKFERTSTANHRGHLATWLIEDGGFFLVEFTARQQGSARDLVWLFPAADGKVSAEWYTGTLHIDMGKVLLRKLRGYALATEKLVVVEIEKGAVKSTREFRYPDNIPVINRRLSAHLGRKFDIRTMGN